MRKGTIIRLDQWRTLLAARRSTHIASIVVFADQDHDKLRLFATRCKLNGSFFDPETHTHLLSLFLRKSTILGLAAAAARRGYEERKNNDPGYHLRRENYMHAVIRSYTRPAGNLPYPWTPSLNVSHLYQVMPGVLLAMQFPRLHSLQLIWGQSPPGSPPSMICS